MPSTLTTPLQLGAPLLVQQLHTDAVTGLSTMAAAPGRHGGLPGNQHCIVVLLRSCVCVVEGGSLVEAAKGECVEGGMWGLWGLP